MHIVLEPLKEAEKNGIEMIGADRAVCMVFPIFSSYVADYLEQCLVTCTKSTTCPKCCTTADNLQDNTPAPLRTNSWTKSVFEDAKKMSSSPSAFHKKCMESDVSGGIYAPFWNGFPLTDIHHIITPDVLHQLNQGIFKHIVHWCQIILKPEELDRRIRALPISYGL